MLGAPQTNFRWSTPIFLWFFNVFRPQVLVATVAREPILSFADLTLKALSSARREQTSRSSSPTRCSSLQAWGPVIAPLRRRLFGVWPALEKLQKTAQLHSQFKFLRTAFRDRWRCEMANFAQITVGENQRGLCHFWGTPNRFCRRRGTTPARRWMRAGARHGDEAKVRRFCRKGSSQRRGVYGAGKLPPQFGTSIGNPLAVPAEEAPAFSGRELADDGQ